MAEIWQSDLRVKMSQEKKGKYLIYDLVIRTDNDDASRSPHLIFSLPRNSQVRGIKFSKGFEQTAYQIYGSDSQALPPKTPSIDGYVKVDFRNLNRETVKIKISILEVDSGWKRGDGASAFVFGLTPERNKKNNFAYLPLR